MTSGLLRTLAAVGSALLLATTAHAARQPASSAAAKRAPQFEVLPLVRSSQNQLLVRAIINGKPAWLGVDSGAPVSAIALHRREYFRLAGITPNSDLPSRVQVNQGFSNVAIVRSFRLGELNLIDQPVVTLNLRGSSRATRSEEGQRLDGILGADILFPLEAVLDCQAKVLILKMNPDRAGHAPGLDYRGFSAIPIQVSEGFNLYVTGAVNGTPAKLMVDTGAFATLLHRPFVRQMRIPMQETRIVSAAINLKEHGVNVARIRKLSVGSVDIVGSQVGVVDLEGLIHNRLLQGSPPVVGLLGGELLNRQHAIIDFGTRTLYLKRESSKVERSAGKTRR
jgi:predicted aspartyl protease